LIAAARPAMAPRSRACSAATQTPSGHASRASSARSPNVTTSSRRIFIAFYRGLSGYRGEARLSTFLHRIAVNTAYDHLRSRSHRGDGAGPLDAESLAEHLSPALEDQVAARADPARLLALLDQLTPTPRVGASRRCRSTTSSCPT
jgi:hypothetical protein